LLDDQCMMLYYGIAKGAQLEAAEYQPPSEGKKLRIFVRPTHGYLCTFNFEAHDIVVLKSIGLIHANRSEF
jgi:hypothetical protein